MAAFTGSAQFSYTTAWDTISRCEHRRGPRPDLMNRGCCAFARNETDSAAGALHSKRYLITDRDTKYSEQFRWLIRDSGTKVIRLPPRSPNLNAYAERFVRSIKDECLDRMVFVGQGSLRRAVSEYTDHYHTERNHQGLENRLIVARPCKQLTARSVPS
jgi:transposase InsO family protein